MAHIAKLRISESTSRSLMASNRAWVAEKAAAGDVLELYSKWSSESLPSIPVQMEEDVKLPLNNEMSR